MNALQIIGVVVSVAGLPAMALPGYTGVIVLLVGLLIFAAGRMAPKASQ